MTDEQTILILTAISDARQESTEAIGELAEKSSHALGELATKVADFHGEMGARVEIVEEDVKTQKRWSRINAALVPVYAIVHAVLEHLGVHA